MWYRGRKIYVVPGDIPSRVPPRSPPEPEGDFFCLWLMSVLYLHGYIIYAVEMSSSFFEAYISGYISEFRIPSRALLEASPDTAGSPGGGSGGGEREGRGDTEA